MATLSAVTGAASGIGRATAERLAARGDRVLLLDVDEAAGRAAADAIGTQAAFLAIDLAEEASIRAAADRLREEWGAPDVLVNAAGWDRLEPFLDNSWEFMDRIVHLNLLGATKLTHALLPSMIEAGRGRIVNVASDAGRVGSTGETVYASAKGGLISLSKSLAREVARHRITVNCVCPGPTDTPLFRSLPERMQQALEHAIPFRRLAQPAEVASAIAFFASDDASFVTGQVLSVSGGLTMAG